MPWLDNTSTSRPASETERRLNMGIVNPENYGTLYADGVTDDTATIQAAIDAASDTGRRVILPLTNLPCAFTNLKLGPRMSLEGPLMGQISLKRITGATGTAIREKTAGEGNARGGTGIWLRNLWIDGNFTSGDGIDIGNAGGVALNFLSGLENIHVRDFTTGIGMKINQNGAKCSYLWSNANNVGIQTAGGGSLYSGIWAESNTLQDVIIGGAGDKYTYVQVEPGASATESVKFTGSNNKVSIYAGLRGNKTNVVLVASAAVRNKIELEVVTNGFTFVHGIYAAANSVGTGTQAHIPTWVDNANANPSWFYDQSSGKATLVGGEKVVAGGPVTAQVTTTGGRPSAVTAGDGAQIYDTTLNKPIWSDGTVWRDAAGTAV